MPEVPSIPIEDLTIVDYLSTKEQIFREAIYCIPIESGSMAMLDETLYRFLGLYSNDKKNISRIATLSEYLEYYLEMKQILEYDEKKTEYTEDELIDNGFIKTEFVVHEHKATHLHWDFRFKTQFKTSAYSFAIPKAKMPEEGDRILAIRQPMHPPVWVDLKSTKIDSASYGKGSVETIDRGIMYYKVKPKSFVCYLEGEKFKGGYYLIQTDGNNYLFVKSKNSILSNPDERLKELYKTVRHSWDRDVTRIHEIFGIDLSTLKFEPIEMEFAMNIYTRQGFKTVEDYIRWEIASRLGKRLWEAMSRYSQSYLVPVIQEAQFTNQRLEEMKTSDPMYIVYKFSELVASILNGKRMIGGLNMEATIANSIKDHSVEEDIESDEEKDLQDKIEKPIEKPFDGGDE